MRRAAAPSPLDDSSGHAHSSTRGRPGGGSTSCSARAGVEQYSAAIHSARSTSSAGIPSPTTALGATRRSCGTALASANPVTTPVSFCRPKGIRTTDPTSTASAGSL